MTNSEKVFQYEAENLKLEIEKAKKNIPDFRNRHFNKTREKALVFILEQSVDLAEGCLILADSKLPASCNASARVLLEYLFWACWVALSVDNAEKYSQRAMSEIKRSMKKILQKGHGKIIRKKTNEDRTQEILNSKIATDIPNKIEISAIAKETQLERIYMIYYSFLSTNSHGGLYGLESSNDKEEAILVGLSFANVILNCINLVVNNWIDKRKQTPSNTILAILRA